jgi:hypothetical protein
MELDRTTKGIFVSHRKYCIDILEDNGFLATKPAAFLWNPILRLSWDDGDLLPNPTSYCRLIGRLIYLTSLGLTFLFLFKFLVNSCRVLSNHTWLLLLDFCVILRVLQANDFFILLLQILR